MNRSTKQMSIILSLMFTITSETGSCFSCSSRSKAFGSAYTLNCSQLQENKLGQRDII